MLAFSWRPGALCRIRALYAAFEGLGGAAKPSSAEAGLPAVPRASPAGTSGLQCVPTSAMEVLAAAAQQEVLRESDGSLGSSEHVQPQSQRCRWQPTRSGAAARGGSSSAGSPGPAAGGGAGGSGAARTKAAITAEVAASHGARVAADPADALTGWAAEVAEQLGAADAAYTAARDAHQAVRCRDPLGWGSSGNAAVLPSSNEANAAVDMDSAAARRLPCACSTAAPLAPTHSPPSPAACRPTPSGRRPERPTGQTRRARASRQSGTPRWRPRSRCVGWQCIKPAAAQR